MTALHGWKLEERIVALIEKAIQPESTVQHNVKLPETVSRAARQCDVVIWTGPPDRRIFSIVEVQKRKRRVGVADLEGWMHKRDALGAHALICVSLHPFSKSVKNKAGLDARTTLVSFRNLEAAEWPMLLKQIPFNFVYRTIEGVDDVLLQSPELPPENYPDIRHDEKLFLRSDEGPLLTMTELMPIHFGKSIQNAPENNGVHAIPFTETGLKMKRPEGTVSVQMQGVVNVKTASFPIEQRTVRVYEQQDTHPSYWLQELRVPVEDREYLLSILVKPNDNSSMDVRLVSVEGGIDGDKASIKIVGAQSLSSRI